MSIPNIPCKSSTTDLINHLCFCIDQSGSMSGFKNDVIKVFDAQVARLAEISKTNLQETRVTIYLFSDTIQCIAFDKDVLRLPSLANLYSPSGGTALMDAIMKSIIDFEKIYCGYGNHAFLAYVISDGEENGSKHVSSSVLTQKIASLPNNFTLACLLPNAAAAHEAKKYGIAGQNISIWDTTSQQGIEHVGNNILQATEQFFNNRAAGIVGSTNLFKLDTSKLTANVVQATLQELHADSYTIYPCQADAAIKAFVEEKTGMPYVKGHSFYLLSKKETVQATKTIYIRERATGKVFSGDSARTLLGLPVNQNIDVKPDTNNAYEIFVESTSVNRKLIGGSCVLVVK